MYHRCSKCGKWSIRSSRQAETPRGRLAAESRESRPCQLSATGVRRLTPRECERLQAFPDDWTRWTDTGKEQADGPRYKQLGNAVTVNVAKWIGGRVIRALLESEAAV